LYSDAIVREQVELVHHATDALHRLQEQLQALRLAGPPVSRTDAISLVAEAFTAFLPITRDPDSFVHLLKESLRVQFGGRTTAEKRARILAARVALYQPKADALWEKDRHLSQSEVARRVAADGPVVGDNKPLTVSWLRAHLVRPAVS
jgi:hypothetical protein